MKLTKQRTYSVLKPFRFSGRNFTPGQEFNARRLDPRRLQLKRWIEDGILGPLGQEIEEEVEIDEQETEVDEPSEVEVDEESPEAEEEA